MPSIRKNADFFERAKKEGAIKPIPTPAPSPEKVLNVPNIPSYPPAPNAALRSTLPANLIQSPDGQRQFFNPATPQTRLFAPQFNSSAFNGAAIQSGVSTFTSPLTPPVPGVPIIPPVPSVGQFYEVNLNGNFEQMYSVNGILLP